MYWSQNSNQIEGCFVANLIVTSVFVAADTANNDDGQYDNNGNDDDSEVVESIVVVFAGETVILYDAHVNNL